MISAKVSASATVLANTLPPRVANSENVSDSGTVRPRMTCLAADSENVTDSTMVRARRMALRLAASL
jgi:hypothetical protein